MTPVKPGPFGPVDRERVCPAPLSGVILAAAARPWPTCLVRVLNQLVPR
jgi:hypothetical protein